MKDTKIKDAVLVSTITGEEKIPVSNGSGKPAAVTVNLILNKVPNPDLSDYVTETELASKGYLTEHLSLDNYALKSELPNTNILATKDEIPNIIYFNPDAFNAEKFEELSALLWPDGDGLSHTLVLCLNSNDGGVSAYTCDVQNYDAECIYLSYLRLGTPLSPIDKFNDIPFFIDQYELLKDGTINKYTLVISKPEKLPISTLSSEATLEEVITAYNDLVSKLIEIGTLIEPDEDDVIEEN